MIPPSLICKAFVNTAFVEAVAGKPKTGKGPLFQPPVIPVTRESFATRRSIGSAITTGGLDENASDAGGTVGGEAHQAKQAAMITRNARRIISLSMDVGGRNSLILTITGVNKEIGSSACRVISPHHGKGF